MSQDLKVQKERVRRQQGEQGGLADQEGVQKTPRREVRRPWPRERQAAWGPRLCGNAPGRQTGDLPTRTWTEMRLRPWSAMCCPSVRQGTGKENRNLIRRTIQALQNNHMHFLIVEWIVSSLSLEYNFLFNVGTVWNFVRRHLPAYYLAHCKCRVKTHRVLNAYWRHLLLQALWWLGKLRLAPAPLSAGAAPHHQPLTGGLPTTLQVPASASRLLACLWWLIHTSTLLPVCCPAFLSVYCKHHPHFYIVSHQSASCRAQ